MLVVFLSWFIKMNEWLTTTQKYISIDRFMPLVYILRFDIYQIGMIIRFFPLRAVCFGCRNRWINICRVFNGKYQFGAEMEAAKKPNTSSTNAFDLWLSAHFRADLMSFFFIYSNDLLSKISIFCRFRSIPFACDILCRSILWWFHWCAQWFIGYNSKSRNRFRPKWPISFAKNNIQS